MSSIGDWPAHLRPYRWEFHLRPNSQKFESPITRTRQVLEGQGQQWQALGAWRIEVWTPEGRRIAGQFEAMLDKMKGQVNTVMMPDFGVNGGRPVGPNLDLSSIGLTYFTDGGSPEVITQFTDGNSPETLTAFSGGTGGLTIYGGWPVGADRVLVRGFPQHTTQLYANDNVQIGSFLYRLTEDAVADGLNRAYLYLNRPLLEDIAHQDSIITLWARTPMSLLDDDQTRRSMTSSGPVRDYTISFVESLFFLNEGLSDEEEAALTDSPDGTEGTYVVIDGEEWTLG